MIRLLAARALGRLALAAGLVTASTASAAAAQLQDGSFETPAIGVGTYQYFTGTQGSWSFAGYSGVINTAAGPTAFNSQPATNGSQVAFVQQVNQSASSVSQLLGGLTIGTPYLLSFDIAGRNCNCGYDGNTSWGVYFGGSLIGSGTTTSGQTFASQSFSFTPTSTSGALSFANEAPGTGDHTFMLDNVQLAAQQVTPPTTATPEPASLALMASGLLGLAAAMRSRRRA